MTAATNDPTGPVFADAEDVQQRLDGEDYLVDEGTGDRAVPRRSPSASRCCSRASRASARPPAAKALARALDAPLIRLQCYEGLTAERGALRVELPAPAAGRSGWPSRGTSRSPTPTCSPRSSSRNGPILQAIRHDGPVAAGAADRRDRPGRRRVRGAAVRVPRRGSAITIPEIGTFTAAAPPGRRADLQPQPRAARRAAAALPLPLDRLPRRRSGRPRSCAARCPARASR